jgi:hypothetical protein
MEIKKGYICFILCLVLLSIPAHAADQSICDEGSRVVLYENGDLRSCILKDNYEINGVTCISGYLISYYPNGNLEYCVLYGPVTIGSTQCRENGSIIFYENGDLQSCVKPD